MKFTHKLLIAFMPKVVIHYGGKEYPVAFAKIHNLGIEAYLRTLRRKQKASAKQLLRVVQK